MSYLRTLVVFALTVTAVLSQARPPVPILAPALPQAKPAPLANQPPVPAVPQQIVYQAQPIVYATQPQPAGAQPVYAAAPPAIIAAPPQAAGAVQPLPIQQAVAAGAPQPVVAAAAGAPQPVAAAPVAVAPVAVAPVAVAAGAPQPVVAAAAGAPQPVAAAAGAVPAATDGGLPTVPQSQAQIDAAKATTVISTAHFLQGEVLDMQWVGDDKNVVLVLTEEAILHRSADFGKTFENQMVKIQLVAAENKKTITGVRYMLVSPADSKRVMFVGNNNAHFLTKDGGATFELVNSLVPFEDIKLHPTDPESILAAEDTCATKKAKECYRKLWMSKDFGQEWTFLAERVQQFDWYLSIPEDIRPVTWIGGSKNSFHRHQIIATIFRKSKNGHQNLDTWDTDIDFVITNDKFKTQEVLVPHGNRFLIMKNRFFVARSLPSTAKKEGGVGLMVMLPILGIFSPVFMPKISDKLQHHGFTVVDTSEGQVFLQINHQGEGALWGNLYISGAAGVQYSLSLPDNRRNADGTCDFAKFEGLEGVYVANIYDSDSLVGSGSSFTTMGKALGDTQETMAARKKVRKVGTDPNIRTVMTFNKGGQWSLLNPPVSDSRGQPTNCNPTGGCSLHIHGTSDYWGPFYSLDSAIGLAMATGNLGDRLTPYASKTNTYLTRDGGLSWIEAAKGSHIYEFGDHGGIILMARDNVATQTLSYSWDHGLSWNQYKFAADPVEVNNIIVERSGKDVIFLLYGTMDSRNKANKKKARQSVIYFLDFSSTLRACDGAASATNDFEQWEPRGSFQSPCILGHEVKYTRRKRDVACLTGKFHSRKSFIRDCPCQEDDYECDIDYHKPHQKGACQIDEGMVPNKTLSILHQCSRSDSSGMYYDPNGYRKIAGDTCVGGIAHVGNQVSCPSWAYKRSGGTWFGFLFKIVLAVCFVGLLLFTERGRQTLSIGIELVSKVTSLFSKNGNGSSRGYEPVSRHDDLDEMSFRKKKTPNRNNDDRTFQPFTDDGDDDDDDDVEAGGTMRSRTKQQSALDRVAAALEPLDDDDDDLDLDDLGDDLDDFNPRADEPESLI